MATPLAITPQTITSDVPDPTSSSSVSTPSPWWVALIAGVALTITGLLLVLAPGLTLILLVRFLGFYWLVDGIVRLVSIFVDRTGWGWNLFVGVLGVFAGVAVIDHPLWSAIFIPSMVTLYVGVLGVIIGAVELVMAFRGAGWGTGILGVSSIVFGVLLTFNPLAGAIALPLLFGGLAIVGGISTAVLAFQRRSTGTT